MFRDIVIASLFNEFHEQIDDQLLDKAASAAGCSTGIGRMCLLSDTMVEYVVSCLGIRPAYNALDIGCGRGFLERWLSATGANVTVVGIDRAPAAIAAARSLAPDAKFLEVDYRTFKADKPFDAVVALELTINGAIDVPLVSAVRRALRSGGRFVITAASLDGRHEERLKSGLADLAQNFSNININNATEVAGDFARRLYEVWLDMGEWAPEIASKMQHQAHEVLQSLDRGDFHYSIISGDA